MGGGQPNPASIPAEFRDRLGTVTVSRTVPELKKFVEAGGTLLAIGSSTSIGYHFGCRSRTRSSNVQRRQAQRCRCRREKFYVPGAILEARVDTTNPLAYGLEITRQHLLRQ